MGEKRAEWSAVLHRHPRCPSVLQRPCAKSRAVDSVTEICERHKWRAQCSPLKCATTTPTRVAGASTVAAPWPEFNRRAVLPPRRIRLAAQPSPRPCWRPTATAGTAAVPGRRRWRWEVSRHAMDSGWRSCVRQSSSLSWRNLCFKKSDAYRNSGMTAVLELAQRSSFSGGAPHLAGSAHRPTIRCGKPRRASGCRRCTAVAKPACRW